MVKSYIPRKRRLAPSHPGEIVRDLLEDLRIPVQRAAADLGISRQQLHRILGSTHPVTPEMALRLGKFFGNGPDLWLRLQQDWDLHHAEKKMKAELRKIPTQKNAA